MDPDRSFEHLYRRHRRDVYWSVLRDLRDPHEAEDVTQAAFLNAFRALRRGARPEKPRAWLLTIARNVVRRRAQVRSGHPREVELDPELASALDLEASSPVDICAALGRLTDGQRRAILLREIQGRSYAEVGEELDLSLPAVEALIFRARRALAEELALAGRAPTVRGNKRRGLLALPGLAKLGSLGFSLGRACVACVVGCAVVAVGPGTSGAGGVRAPRPEPLPRAAAVDRVQVERMMRPDSPKRRPKSKGGGQAESAGGAAGASQQPSSGSQSGLVPIPLPSLSTPLLPLPSVSLPLPPLPSAQPPSVDLPAPPRPADPGVPALPDLTS